MDDGVATDQDRLERLSFLLGADDEEAVAWRKGLSRMEYIKVWREYQILKRAVGQPSPDGEMREAVLVAG